MNFPAPPHGIAQGSRRVDATTHGAGHAAPGRDGFHRQGQTGQHAFCGGNFIGRHLFEIQCAQTFLGGHGARSINFDFSFGLFVVRCGGRFRGRGPIQDRLGRAFFSGL